MRSQWFWSGRRVLQVMHLPKFFRPNPKAVSAPWAIYWSSVRHDTICMCSWLWWWSALPKNPLNLIHQLSNQSSLMNSILSSIVVCRSSVQHNGFYIHWICIIYIYILHIYKSHNIQWVSTKMILMSLWWNREESDRMISRVSRINEMIMPTIRFFLLALLYTSWHEWQPGTQTISSLLDFVFSLSRTILIETDGWAPTQTNDWYNLHASGVVQFRFPGYMEPDFIYS